MLFLVKGYVKQAVSIPEEPEVARIYDEAARKTYINRAARKGANVIVLIPDGNRGRRKLRPVR